MALAQVVDFFDASPIEGLTVETFADNALRASCGGACDSQISGPMGQLVFVDEAGSWFSYRVRAGEGAVSGTTTRYVETSEINAIVPRTGEPALITPFASSTRDTIVTLIGAPVRDDTALLMGTFEDCEERPVANAVVRLFDDAGEIPLSFGRDGARAFFFNGDSFPSASETSTQVDGLFGVANVPLRGGAIRVEVWGSTSPGAPAELLGCEQIRASEAGVGLARVPPLRRRSPGACGSEG